MEANDKKPETRWEALKEIMDRQEYRTAIGFAWPLYFYTIFNGNHDKKQLITSYPELNKKMNEPVSTIKRWKDRLVEQKIALSAQGNHQWTLTLLPPYDTPLTCLKTDHTELLIKSDDRTKKLMKKMFSSESMGLLPLIAELTHKVERLEQSNK